MSLPTTDDATLRTSDTAREMWELVKSGAPAEARRTYPSGWLWLTGETGVRKLLDNVLDAGPDDRYGVEDLRAGTDLDDAAVERAVDALVSLGVLVADEGTYCVNQHSIVLHAATELSRAVETSGVADPESGLEYLGRYESVRLMVDALLAVDPGRALEQKDLHRLTGVSRKRVWHHVEKLVALGAVEESGEKYRAVTESAVLRSVQSLDAAVVGAALSASHP
ncbi:helix-turn-helix domain-containing protein [Halorussus litoreus]|uniref:hypothetical protein n=1 Tax=Halorussus litoreus TaxID=1710536 RepID=UPI000E26DCFD|nr:hypothetical protein [Halorussus litoreus]